MRSRGGKDLVMNYTIKIIIEMLQISWLFSFQEKDKIVNARGTDDGRRLTAIDNLSVSGD